MKFWNKIKTILSYFGPSCPFGPLVGSILYMTSMCIIATIVIAILGNQYVGFVFLFALVVMFAVLYYSEP